MTDEPWDTDDDRLMLRLRRLAKAADPPPAAVVEEATASFSWRTADAELAALVLDSVVDGPALAGVRGGEGRRLTFETADLTVEMEVTGERQLLGQLVPPVPALIEIRRPGGSATITTDAFGRFRADDVGSGPLSLRCRPGQGDGPPTDTDWVLI